MKLLGSEFDNPRNACSGDNFGRALGLAGGIERRRRHEQEQQSRGQVVAAVTGVLRAVLGL